MNPTPSQPERPEHNPDGLTPEQYGAPEWRLLREQEIITRGDEWWTGVEWDLTLLSKSDNEPPCGNTYRRRVATRTPAPEAVAGKRKCGAELILIERNRQTKEEGWTAEHDDAHDSGELAKAAACYVQAALLQEEGPIEDWRVTELAGKEWAWDLEYWKPAVNDPIRNLVKAGALIAAEIDRLIRSAKKQHIHGTTLSKETWDKFDEI